MEIWSVEILTEEAVALGSPSVAAWPMAVSSTRMPPGGDPNPWRSGLWRANPPVSCSR